MEEISSRRSSNEEFFGSSLMEPTVHDVMSLELSHQSNGDNYLDPTSFGDGGSFDEFGGQIETRYESHGYDQSIRSHSYHQGQPLPPPGSRFDHHVSHPPMRSGVPTYPVKTVDPSTPCAPFAPARMTFRIKPPRIRHNGRPKKEPMDPKTVEDEVARNVSQILSATKQQKLAQEAQQRCGIVTPITRINFSCSDCGKAMTSHRNLQRHRQTSCCRKVGEWVDRSQSWPGQWSDKDPMSEDSDSLQGLNPYSFSSEGWCSPNRSYSPSAVGSIDMGSMLPLSLDTDDSQTHSSSASHCSNSSNGKGAQETFTCDSCKKTVCSLRSLKRHHTTCKQYMAEFGSPQDIDSSSVVPVKRKRSARRVTVPKYKEESSTTTSSSGNSSPEQGDDLCEVPTDTSTQNDDDRAPKQTLAVNTCADCNRQLCSASNLKRHRATCKAALTRGESSHSSSTGTPTYTTPQHLPELPARDRNIIDRSYAAAVAASAQKAMIAQGRQTEQKEEEKNHHYSAFIVSAPQQQRPAKSQNWVTVGEHLRAKHILQKTESKDEPQGAVLIQSTPPPGAPVHNQILEIRRPSLVEKEVKEERPLSHRNEPTVYKVSPSIDTKPEIKIKDENPPLESIITTQPLSGDRVTGVPVLVHDSRQYNNGIGCSNSKNVRDSRESIEFQCPECKKTYSCRKNVKRHRMAVHKLSPEDIGRYPGPGPCPHAILGDLSQLSPSLPKILLPSKVDIKLDFKTETLSLSPILSSSTLLDKGFSQDASWHSLDYMEEDEREESARIAADLKRKIELNNSIAEEKNSRPELAEADTTFSEDNDFNNGSHHSSPGVVSSSGPLPSLASWVGSKPLSVEIPYGGTRSAGHSPLFKSRRLDYDFPSSFLQNDDIPLDPMLGHGPSSAPRTFDDDDMWYKTEEMPDSTTSARSTSPCALLEEPQTPQLGTLPYTRKRALSGGNSTSPSSNNNNSTNGNAGQFINDPKQARHPCQECGKFYSSEWNLERHRKENCSTSKNGSGAVSPVASPSPNPLEDVSILMGSCRFVLPKSALTKASGAFCSLFQIHDPNKGELRLDGDPMDFQNLLDVYNDPANLNRTIVDTVLGLADQYKFGQVTDACSKFIAEELSKVSLMHAIRLADQYKLLSVKQRLFSSISIEVFRALNSDRDYQMMSSELKAELLEKWGTFL